MTEETHKKLNLWLETVAKCLRIGVLLFQLMTVSYPFAVASNAHRADYVQHQVQS
ncbi:hypothetical protein G3O00_33020 [Burkholderia sp. Ac-20384]|uniref:hypothetical protein n=1 Tax=Burkholderia sp. Ac-20384 TaxID=2703902 RepID=UPI00197EB742|nr:hypothetical protein [Burkholderia sp. Ac-20384]MBN3828396.1 hypothetical protein [Burkholderia sp. Ac-20384]